MGNRVSLREVAAAAEVATSTASLALAGDRRVSSATRERIERWARELGYVRDPLLASLAAGRFRHQGKPVVVAINTDRDWFDPQFNRRAATYGMCVRQLRGPTIDAGILSTMGAAALVVDRRGIDQQELSALPVPVVLWNAESGAGRLLDAVDFCDWWATTTDAVARVRHRGYRRPAIILIPAIPRHWQDDIRLAAARQLAVPVIEWDQGGRVAVNAFLKRHRPDAVIGNIIAVRHALEDLPQPVAFASLMVFSDGWADGFAGWVIDQAHRERVTLELIEQRLRYGPRQPNLVIITPQWRDGPSLPIIGDRS